MNPLILFFTSLSESVGLIALITSSIYSSKNCFSPTSDSVVRAAITFYKPKGATSDLII